MNLIKSLFGGPKPKRILEDIQIGTSLEDFRAEQVNVAAWERFLNSPPGRKGLGVLLFHRPRGFPLRGNATVEGAALEHMRREGHEGCIMLVEALAKGAPKQEGDVPITWGVEEGEIEEVT